MEEPTIPFIEGIRESESYVKREGVPLMLHIGGEHYINIADLMDYLDGSVIVKGQLVGEAVIALDPRLD